MATRAETRRKQFHLDASVLSALEALARDTETTLDRLADEAFRDLLKKRRRPLSLREALAGSMRHLPANDREPRRARTKA